MIAPQDMSDQGVSEVEQEPLVRFLFPRAAPTVPHVVSETPSVFAGAPPVRTYSDGSESYGPYSASVEERTEEQRGMIRSQLTARLMDHRDNDVRVYVPTEHDGAYILDVEGVAYDPTTDVILIDTEVLLDGPDEEEHPGGAAALRADVVTSVEKEIEALRREAAAYGEKCEEYGLHRYSSSATAGVALRSVEAAWSVVTARLDRIEQLVRGEQQ